MDEIPAEALARLRAEIRAEVAAEERERAQKEARAEVERMLDFRDWQVHFYHWDCHELHLNGESGLSALLNWLPESILEHELPTRRSLRAHLELVKSEVDRVWRNHGERMTAAYEQKLTGEQLRRKYDPLSGEYSYGDPGDPDDSGRVGEGPLT